MSSADLTNAIISGNINYVIHNIKSWGVNKVLPEVHLTPLQLAASKASKALVETILVQGATINEKDEKGRTALWHAIEANQWDTATYLIRRKANPLLTDEKGDNPFYLALTKDNIVLIERMILNDPNILKRKVKGDDYPLDIAIKSKNYAIVQLLLSKNAPVDMHTFDTAFQTNDTYCFEMILKKFPATWSSKLQTFLIKSIQARNIAFIDFILNLAQKDNIALNRFDILKEVICLPSPDNETLFLHLIKHKTFETFNWNEREKTSPNYTLIFHACTMQSKEIVRYLVKNGADINAVNSSYFKEDGTFTTGGETPLQGMSCAPLKSPEDHEFLNFLIELGADPTKINADNQGRTAHIDYISMTGNRFLNVKLDDYSKEYLRIKKLGHVIGFDGTYTIPFANRRIPIEGSFSPYMHKKLWQSASQFYKEVPNSVLDKKQQDDLLNAIQSCFDGSLDNDSLLKKIHNSELVILLSGWDEHSLDIIFHNGKMIISNGGVQWKNNAFLEIYDVNLVRLTSDIINRIKCVKQKTYQEGGEFIYETLPQLLGATRGGDAALLQTHQPPSIASNNCAYNSGEMTLYAIYSLFGLKNATGNPISPQFTAALEEAKTLLVYAKAKRLLKMLHLFNRFEKNMAIKSPDKESEFTTRGELIHRGAEIVMARFNLLNPATMQEPIKALYQEVEQILDITY